MADRELSYDIGGWPTISGAQRPLVVLDPESMHVYTWGAVGAGSPEPVWHGRHRVLGTVPVEADPDGLLEVLQSQERKIRKVASLYLGSEWDGSNRIGRWEDSEEDWEDSAEDDLDLSGVATYWDASEWYAGDPCTVTTDALASESIEAAAAAEVEQARLAWPPILLQQADAEDALRELLEQERERLDELIAEVDEDEERDADEANEDRERRDKVRALLG